MASRSCVQSVFSGSFVLVVLGVLALAYYVYVFKVYLPLTRLDSMARNVLIGFHLLLTMQVWSLLQTMTTDPGIVPPYWGFYSGDAEAKRKRYCLMCHVFKPERSHHCSICNRCVLNMDHHCPWVNNCIGFYNRKFFIQLLVYTLLLLFYVDVTLFPVSYHAIIFLSSHPQLDTDRLLLLAFSVFVGLLSLVLSLFCKFHMQLVLTNSTTIENLEAEEGKEVLRFSMGCRANWMQVFGRNPWLWVLPLMGRSGKPVGDGVTWLLPTSGLDDYVPDSVRHSVESPRPSTSVHRTMTAIREQDSDVQPENTEEQNHTSVVVVNMKLDRNRPSDVDTDSSFLTNAALIKGTSAQADDSYLRELSGKPESPQPSPMQSPDGVLEISLRDPQLFRREMSE